MREIEHKVLLVSLAVFVSLLAVVQPMRPILAADLSEMPAAANLHQQLTRHCIEEVRSDKVEEPDDQADSSRAGTQNLAPARRPGLATDIDLPARSPQPIHRKLLPPSPEDG